MSTRFIKYNKQFIRCYFYQVYVWIGSKCRVEEKKFALEAAVAYEEVAPDKRPRKPPVYFYEGHESPEFRSLFHPWLESKPCDEKVRNRKLFNKQKKKLTMKSS